MLTKRCQACPEQRSQRGRRVNPIPLAVALLLTVGTAWAVEQFDAQGQFIVDPESPLGRGEHPRLHITRGTLPYFRERVSTPRSGGGFREEFQRLVSWVDNHFDVVYEKSSTKEGLTADRHALIHLLGMIPGVNYRHSLEEYGRQAIQIMMMRTAMGGIAGRQPHGEDDLRVVSRTYDWMWEKMTLEEKRTIAFWLADASFTAAVNSVGIENCMPEAIFSSSYFEAVWPWYAGLAIYGDDVAFTTSLIRPNVCGQNLALNTAHEAGVVLVGLFDRFMLNGRWLDAQNWAAREQGGPSEVGGYGSWHPRKHVVNMDAWGTATGMNYFAQGSATYPYNYFIRYYPQYAAYLMEPMNPPLLVGKWGQTATGNRIGTVVPRAIGEALKPVDVRMAQLNRWLVSRLGQNDEFSTLDYFYRILFEDTTTVPRSPQELGLPLTQHFEGIGMVVMRTGFEDKRDTVFIVGAPEYQLTGHTWGTKGGGLTNGVPLGFSLSHLGPLLFKIVGDDRGAIEGQRQNIMRFNEPGYAQSFAPNFNDTFGGFFAGGGLQRVVSDIFAFRTDDPRVYRAGVTRLMRFDDTRSFDYVFADVRRNYDPNRVRTYTRQYVYLRAPSLNDSAQIVIFDRVETTRPEVVKRWEVSMAYNPEISKDGSVAPGREIRPGWSEYAGNEVVVSNDLDPDPYNRKSYPDAHGKVFLKTLLPRSARVIKIGGLNHEFESDRGVYEQNGVIRVVDGADSADICNRIAKQSAFGSDYGVLCKEGALYTGTYHVDVIPVENNVRENFLHVLQTADTQNPTQSAQMVRTELIDTGNMQGAFIEGTAASGQPNAVVLFAKEERVLGRQESVTYTVTGDGPCRHLIADLPAGVDYTIIVDDHPLDGTFRTDDARTNPARQSQHPAAGVLSFTTTLGSMHQIRIVPEPSGEPIRGDVNQDGMVNLRDAIQLLRWIAGQPGRPAQGTPLFITADVNRDGRLTLADFICLLRGIMTGGTLPC